MEHNDILINEGFQSSLLDKSVYQLKSINFFFQYPSVSLTEAALELAKVIPLFSESNKITLITNSNCIILSQGYERIFEALSQLRNLEILIIQIGNRCLFDQDIISYLMNASQKWLNLQELSISINQNNILNKNGLKQLDQIKQMKNLSQIILIIQNLIYLQDEVLLQFCDGLSQLYNLKALSILIDFNQLDDLILKQLGKTLQDLEKLENLSFLTTQNSRSKKINEMLRYLKNHPNLNCLEISFQTFENQDVYELLQNLNQLRGLKKINFGLSRIEQNGKSDKVQQPFLKEMQLEVCNLSFLNFEKFDHKFTQQFLSNIQLQQNLKELSFNAFISQRMSTSEDEVKIMDLSLLGKSLKYLHNLEKLTLILHQKYEGFEILCEGINSLYNLKQLIFFICAQEAKRQRKKIGISIGQCLKNKNSLQMLALNYNQIICLEEAISISEAISHLINVEDVTIQLNQKINNYYIFMISQSLNQLSRLKHLQLSKNQFFVSFNQLFKTNQESDIINSFSLANLINLQTLNICVFVKDMQAEELYFLSDSLISMKNLKCLKLVLESNYQFKTIVLDYLKNGLSNLVNLVNISLKIDFDYHLNQKKMFFGRIFQNMKHLKSFELSTPKKLTQYDFYDLAYGFKFLKNLSQLKINIQNTFQIQILDHFSNMLAQLQNLSILELSYFDQCYLSKQMKDYENFVILFGSLKKLNYFVGTRHLIKLIKNQINVKKIQLNNLIIIGQYNSVIDDISYHNWQRQEIIQYSSFTGYIPYYNWQRQEIYQEQTQDHTEKDYQLQLKSIQTIVDKIIINETLNESQITNLINEIKEYTFLEKLEILFSINLNCQQDISYLQDSLSSLKFLKNLNISSQTITNQYTIQQQIANTKLSACLINAISQSLKNLIYLQALTLEISKQNGTIKLSDGIQSLQNLKQLNLSLNNFSNEDWIDFNFIDTLNKLKQLDQLQLNIIDSQFGEKEAEGLSIGLIYLKNLSNLEINFGNNSQINEQGVKSIGEAINHLENLKSLKIVIGESNCIALTGAESIMGLESYLNKLLFLDNYSIKINQKNNLTTQIFDKLQKLKECYIKLINIELNLNNVPSIEQLHQQYDRLYKIFNINQNFEVKFEKKVINDSKHQQVFKRN